MNFPEAMSINRNILVRENGRPSPLPAWAKTEIWLGWWCRRFQLVDSRLLVVAVLPTRELAAAFAGLGALLAGAQIFDQGFSWDTFKQLNPRTEIFWGNGTSRFQGEITEPTVGWPEETVPILITKVSEGRQSFKDTILGVSENKFNEMIFSQSQLPAQQGTASMANALQLLMSVGIQTNSNWLWDSNAEACIVTTKSWFWSAIDSLDLMISEEELIPFKEMICTSSNNDNILSKLKVMPVTKVHNDPTPVTILDGPSAWKQISHIDRGNVLVFLDRDEYSAEIHNLLLEVANVSEDPPIGLLESIPESIPLGMELTSYLIRKE